MKKLLFGMLIIFAAASCKKDGAPAPKEKMLSSIYEDDKLRYTFEYSSDKKLKKVKKYADGAVAPIQEDSYEYDGSGYLKEKMRVYFSTPTKYVYECNNSGQVTKISVIDLTGADSGKVEQWSSYSYNAKNQLIKINYYLGDDSPEGYETLEYAANTSLASVKAYGEKPGGSILLIFWKYTGASNRVHPGIKNAFPEPDKKELMYLDAKSIDITLYANGIPSVITNLTMSDRKSGPGVYLQQTVTTKQTFPVASVPQAKEMRYEYVEI